MNNGNHVGQRGSYTVLSYIAYKQIFKYILWTETHIDNDFSELFLYRVIFQNSFWVSCKTFLEILV